MDLPALITAFRAWLDTNPTVYKADYGTPIQSFLICDLHGLTEAFQTATAVTIRPATPADNTDWLLAWYEQIYLPAQG
jgi:hypothetical protein